MADLEFFEVYGIDFIYGGEILEKLSLRRSLRDSMNPKNVRYIINETLWNGIKEDVGEPVGYRNEQGEVLMGVVKDFHFQSLKFPIRPLMILLRPREMNWSLGLKINSPDISKTLGEVEKEFNEMREKYRINNLPPGVRARPMVFNSIKDTFNRRYDEMKRIRTASMYFSILAVLIAILGLFGLSTFMVQRRTKEVGIRKALGSSEKLIFVELAKEFLKWVAISVIVGLPLGWFLMEKWLQEFATRASISFWVYASIAAFVFIIALCTVAWHSFRASRTNPVDSLRFE